MSVLRTPSLWLALLLGLSLAVTPALADDEKDEDAIDYLALAGRLLLDGHADRAEGALLQVDLQDPTLDKQRFYNLKGLAALSQKHFEDAAKAFEAALKAPPPAGELQAKDGKQKRAKRDDTTLRLYLAKSYFGMEAWAKVVSTLERAGKSLDDKEATYQMLAQAHWKLKQPAPAIAALEQGAKRFPDNPDFLRTQLFYLVELGLFQRAGDLGERYLSRSDATAEDFIAVSEAFRNGDQAKRAGLLLEGAHLRYPSNDRVLLALAHTYIDREKPLSAAIILEDAARIDSKYAIEAAELYIQAGRHTRALALNAQIHDQKAKFKQRLSIMIAMEHFESVGGMAPTLERLGLLKDDQVRYALAYALYKVGDFKGAEKHLKRLTTSALVESANQLRKAMAACKADGWQCT